MKKICFVLLLLALLPHPAFAQKADASAKTIPVPSREKLFNAETFTLSNGLQVVVIPNHRSPVAITMVWYKVGSSDEAPGKSGLAHFLEHLMFKGSSHVPPGELSKRVRGFGGNDNAFTTADHTAYFQQVAVAHLPDVMRLEADRMASILVPADQFESERQVVLEERRQRTENNPQSWFTDQLRYALFPAHPYAVPVIGWKPDIEKLTREDALAWHNRWYAPNNAILVVAGDITAAQLKPMAEDIYGKIPSRPVARAPLPPVNAFPGETRLTLRDPRVRQSEFIRILRAPNAHDNKADSLALSVLEEIVSGNATTRLYKSLVIDQKLATSAGLGYDDTARGPGTLYLTASPADGTALEKLEAAFDAELKKLAETGVTAEELAQAKIRIKDNTAFLRDSLSQPAHIIGEALASGLTLDDVEYWTSDIDTVTADQVKTVAQKYLLPPGPADAPHAVTGYIIAATPAPGAPAPLAPQQEIR